MANDQAQEIERAVGLVANLVVWTGIIGAGLAAVVRWGRYWFSCAWCLVRAMRAASSLVARRGNTCFETIEKETERNHWGVEELRLRLGAAESMLRLGAITADAEQRVEWVSPFAVELFDCDSRELLGRNWLTQIDEAARERLESVWRLACGKRIGASCAVVTVSGKRLRLTICPTVNERGDVVSVYCQIIEAEGGMT